MLFLLQCCQRTSKNGITIREIDSSCVDVAIVDVVKQYEIAFPKDSNIVLFFNLESDVMKMFGKGNYFTMGEFTIPYFEADLKESYLYMPSCYFRMGNKKVFVVPSANILYNEKYAEDTFNKNLWLHKFYDKATHDAWLVRYNERKQCSIVNKRCVLFLGTPVSDAKTISLIK